MTTIQDRIIKDFRDRFNNMDKFGVIYSKNHSIPILENSSNQLEVIEQFLVKSIKEVEEETRKEIEIGCKKLIDNSSVRASILECSQDGYEFGIEDVIKNLSITNKEKQNV